VFTVAATTAPIILALANNIRQHTTSSPAVVVQHGELLILAVAISAAAIQELVTLLIDALLDVYKVVFTGADWRIAPLGRSINPPTILVGLGLFCIAVLIGGASALWFGSVVSAGSESQDVGLVVTTSVSMLLAAIGAGACCVTYSALARSGV
jgi:hypothetical protein